MRPSAVPFGGWGGWARADLLLDVVHVAGDARGQDAEDGPEDPVEDYGEEEEEEGEARPGLGCRRAPVGGSGVPLTHHEYTTKPLWFLEQWGEIWALVGAVVDGDVPWIEFKPSDVYGFDIAFRGCASLRAVVSGIPGVGPARSLDPMQGASVS